MPILKDIVVFLGQYGTGFAILSSLDLPTPTKIIGSAIIAVMFFGILKK